MILMKQRFCGLIGLSTLLVGAGPAQAWVHAGGGGGESSARWGMPDLARKRRGRQLRLGRVLPLRQHDLWGRIEYAYRRLRRHHDENSFRVGHPESQWNDIVFGIGAHDLYGARRTDGADE